VRFDDKTVLRGNYSVNTLRSRQFLRLQHSQTEQRVQPAEQFRAGRFDGEQL
jgi:hypothetical protein